MIALWVGFLAFVLAMLALDLGVFHRHSRVMNIPQALAWSAFWIFLALAFNGFVYFLYDSGGVPSSMTGGQAAVVFFTAYVVEKSLSLDNLFVIAVIFRYFAIPRAQQHRVLFWGILGVLVLRAVMIALGSVLLARLWWVTYVFGTLLIATAVRLLRAADHPIDVARNPIVRLAARLFPVSTRLEEGRFLDRSGPVIALTPLALALIAIEGCDLMFALDSIPAVLAITLDPFIVYTSNVFAVLGLRSLYFALDGTIERFRHLRTAVTVVLGVVGVKLVLEHHLEIPTSTFLTLILAVLLAGVAASIYESSRAPA